MGHQPRQLLNSFVVALILISANALALGVPDRPIGRIHDVANLLSQAERDALESKLAAFETESSNQIVIATFPSLEGESLEDFSIRLAEKWKIGQKGKDNGIILLIFPNDHRLRIEVGYGLEAVVPDAYASRIVEEDLKPAFRRGEFGQGIDAAVDDLIAATQGVYRAEAPKKSRGRFSLLPFILFFLVFFLPFFGRSRRHYWGGGGWTIGGSGGGWSSGGFGGGFGGGGGSFGGGGSSGSW